MKRIKVHSMIFSDASMSFHNLRLYYEDVIALFDQSNKRSLEFRHKMRAEYKSKGREYDTDIMRDIHRFYDEICPNYFHNSFLITACSLFEHKTKEVWNFIQEEHQVPFGWHSFKKPVPERMRILLNFAGVKLRSDPPTIELRPPDFKPTKVYPENRTIISKLYKDLLYYFRVRNCLAHNNGLVLEARGSGSIRRYAQERGILAEQKGDLEIQLNKEFNLNVLDTMRKFFDRLHGVYYSTPLPD